MGHFLQDLNTPKASMVHRMMAMPNDGASPFD